MQVSLPLVGVPARGGTAFCTPKGMTIHSKPTIRTLRGEEAEALLARNQVGRIAFSQHDRVDIEPIHYVYEAPWIFGRTSTGAKILTLSHNSWCAF